MAVLVVAPERQGQLIAAGISNGQDVVTFTDVAAAIRIFTQAFFEAVVCYWDDDYDPSKVCSTLRAMPNTQAVPLFIVTPHVASALKRYVCTHFDATDVIPVDDSLALMRAIDQYPNHVSQPLRALFVDDNAQAREIARQLIFRDFETVEACTAAEAISAFQPGYFDIVVIDYQLGRGRLGSDVLLHIRNLDATTPVLVASNAMSVELAARLILAGADDAFLKCTHAATRARVDRAMRSRQLKALAFRPAEKSHGSFRALLP